MVENVRIVLVDDHPVFRLGMSDLINGNRGLRVCGNAEDTNEALTVVSELNPDLVIVDIT